MSYEYEYPSMGTVWKITIWDNLPEERSLSLVQEAERRSTVFDNTYSRFITSSFVWQIAEKTGVVEVPREFMEMLNWYRLFYAASGRKLTPTMGNALSDLGYDREYRLTPSETVRSVPEFLSSVQVVDEMHIDIKEPILFDVGALGKGYFVDVLSEYLRGEGLTHFLVDGSGDVRYFGGELLKVGLEDPRDESKAIGICTLLSGALCGSAINRRSWQYKGETYNHYIDPQSRTSPQTILATWVHTERAVVADALASALFFVAPEALTSIGIPFEYLIINSEGKAKSSAGFPAELF